nr:photosystem II protein Psb30 [Pedinophyceae sp. YPF-701]
MNLELIFQLVSLLAVVVAGPLVIVLLSATEGDL